MIIKVISNVTKCLSLGDEVVMDGSVRQYMLKRRGFDLPELLTFFKASKIFPKLNF